MNVQVLLADAAQTDSSGKVHALGLGWTITSAPANPMAVIVRVSFDSGEDQEPHVCVVRLLDEDGKPFGLQGTEGETVPLEVTSVITVEKNADHLPSAPMVASIAFNVGGGLPLKPGQQYEWAAEIDGRTHDTWSAPFFTRPKESDGSESGRTSDTPGEDTV